MLTNVPAVSVNGAIGSSTCAYSSAAVLERRHAPRRARPARARRARAPDRAQSSSASTPSSRYALRGSATICARVHAAGCRRHRAGEIAADAVGGFAEDAERGAGELGQRLRERVQLRGLRMLLREVAEEHRALLARREALPRSRLSLVASTPSTRRARVRDGCALRRRGLDDPRERLRQLRRARRSPCARPASAVVVDRVQHRELRALASPPGAGGARCSGWSLRSVAADDEHAVELAQLGDRHAEPRRAGALAVGAEIASAAGGSRRCPMPSPRTSFCSEVQLFERLSAATPARRSTAAPCCATMSFSLAATKSSATCQSTALPLAAALHHRRAQALLGVEAFVREAVLVREPALVDRLVLARQHAHHAVLLDLHDQVRAEAVVRR